MRKSPVYVAVLLAIATLVIACWPRHGAKAAARRKVRPPAVAGLWYPKDKDKLKAEVRGYLSDAEIPKVKGDLLAIMSPHAGYTYCASVMGKAYAVLRGKKYDTVIVVGPSHYAPIRVSIGNYDTYETPLGSVPVDKELCKFLLSHDPTISFVPEAHVREHAIEAQLPFLQETLGNFKLVPILIGIYGDRYWKSLGELLARAASSRNVLFVVSTDMSHYPSSGEMASKIDHATLQAVVSLNPEHLKKTSDKLLGKYPSVDCTLCGLGAMMTVMQAVRLLGADRAVVLGYGNSADIEPDMSRVVGYGAVAFYATQGKKNLQKKTQMKKEEKPMFVNDEEKRELLKLARKTLDVYLSEGVVPPYEPKTPMMRELRAVFVTLKKHGDLRGCIGQIRAVDPLYKAVQKMAIEAATRDPRFPPVRHAELKDIEIEISILTPFEPVKDVSEIEVGKHGLYIRKGLYSGLLLPQVPVEWGWDRDEFLEQVCRKAGLPPGAWKDATLFKFEAQVFNEKELGLK